MTPEQINVAVAEFCGWVNTIQPSQDEYHFLTTKELEEAGGNPVGRNFAMFPDGLHHRLPNYTGSLDACVEFEWGLSDTLNTIPDDQGWQSQRDLYRYHLENIVEPTCAEDDIIWFTITATPLQRCTALLRTIDKWEESP